LADRRPVGLHAHGVDHRVRAAAAGHVTNDVGKVAVVVLVGQDLHAAFARPGHALGHDVDTDHGLGASVHGDPGGHVADGPQAENAHAATGRDVGVLDGLPGRRQHIREVDEAVVGRPV